MTRFSLQCNALEDIIEMHGKANWRGFEMNGNANWEGDKVLLEFFWLQIIRVWKEMWPLSLLSCLGGRLCESQDKPSLLLLLFVLECLRIVEWLHLKAPIVNLFLLKAFLEIPALVSSVNEDQHIQANLNQKIANKVGNNFSSVLIRNYSGIICFLFMCFFILWACGSKRWSCAYPAG